MLYIEYKRTHGSKAFMIVLLITFLLPLLNVLLASLEVLYLRYYRRRLVVSQFDLFYVMLLIYRFFMCVVYYTN